MMQKDIFWLCRKTLLTTFRKPANLLLYFGLPIISIMIAVMSSSGTGQAELQIGVINQDSGQRITIDAIEYVGKMDQVQMYEIKELEVEDKLASGKLDAVVRYPAGFGDSVRNGEPKHIQIVSIKGAQVTGYVEYYLNQYMNMIRSIGQLSEGDPAKFDDLYSSYNQASYPLTINTVKDESINHSKTNRSIGYLLIFMMFSAVNLSGILMKEKENRTYYRLLSSPISSGAYVMSNLIVNFVIMLMQIGVALLVMIGIFDIKPGIPTWSLLFILLFFALVAVSLSVAVIAYSVNSMAANASLNAIIIPTSLMAGCMFPITYMPEWMQQIATFFPQWWLLDTLSELQLGESLIQLSLNLGILLAFAMTFALVSIYKFSRNDDTRIVL